MADYTARDATILTLISQNPGCSEQIFERLTTRADEEKTRILARKVRDKYFQNRNKSGIGKKKDS